MRTEKITIVSHEIILFINAFDVVYYQPKGLSLSIVLADGTKHVVSKQLSKVQCQLPDYFVRISQCVIINKLYLNKIDIAFGYTLAIRKLLQRIGSISTESTQGSACSAKSIATWGATMLETA